PKRGFKNHFTAEYTTVNVGVLENFAEGTVITAELLQDAGLIGKIMPYGLKVLGDGELTKNLTVQANKFTKSAQEKIEKAGGKAEVL
ncbi:MAG: 50S ribosomal protein L15, partial [Clostridia bacterium]|nr:50S ribosomal protein L15 [Clostridia bacterium]